MGQVAEVKNLVVNFDARNDQVLAVDGVSFAVKQGEILALVGESGSGKTITARSLIRLLASNARVQGSIEVDGIPVLSADKSGLLKLRGESAAMVFQEPSTALNPVFTIGWQLEEGLRAHGIDKAKRSKIALEMLEAVGIPEPKSRYNDYPHQFSGGQKQRIVIAMALALNPKLIIADEPTTALDVTVQKGILALLKKCREQLNSSIIIITHNMGVVADMADRVIVMYKGKIVEEAGVRELFYSPQHEYTKALLSAVPKLGVPKQTQKVIERTAESEVLALKDVSVTYRVKRKNVQAVNNVSFSLYKNEVLGLVGESGSGKSTIGKAIAGLTPFSSGEINLFGKGLNSHKRSELKELRQRIGFIFQDPASSFNPFMTISECIAEPIKLKGNPGSQAISNRVAELLDAVQLPGNYANRYPYELSGGQRQRVGIARAIALNPELIIADEPTSALDVSVQAKVLELFQDLQTEFGFACLFISHDLAVVEQLSDRVIVLRNGQVIEEGDVATILGNPQQEYTRTLIDSVPVADPDLQRSRG